MPKDEKKPAVCVAEPGLNGIDESIERFARLRAPSAYAAGAEAEMADCRANLDNRRERVYNLILEIC